jgi:Tfp pilus assembly protein PilF
MGRGITPKLVFVSSVAIAFLLLAAAEAHAQIALPEPELPATRHTISGNIVVGRGGSPGERLEVILVSATGGGRREVFAESTGRFIFDNLLAGSYTVTVRAPYKSGYEDATADVLVFNANFSRTYTVTLTLKPTEGLVARPPAGALVDASVPEAARDAHAAGVEASSKGDREAAVARFKEALAIAPAYGAALNDLGVELLRLERAAEAADVLGRAVAARPEDFAPRFNLSLARFALGDLDAAAAEVGRALAIEPTSSRALCVSGQIDRRRGRLVEAADALKRALDRADDMQAAAAFELGMVYEAAGDPASAAGAYRLVLLFEPDGARATTAHERLRALGAE